MGGWGGPFGLLAIAPTLGDAAVPPEQVDRAAGPLWGWRVGGLWTSCRGEWGPETLERRPALLFSSGLLKRVQLPLT